MIEHHAHRRLATSVANLFVALLIIGPRSQELGAPTIPGRFKEAGKVTEPEKHAELERTIERVLPFEIGI